MNPSNPVVPTPTQVPPVGCCSQDPALAGLPFWQEPLHQSSIKSCIGCPRYFMFRNRLSLSPKQKPVKKAARLGKLIHLYLRYGPDGIDQTETLIGAEATALSALIEAGDDPFGELQAKLQLLWNTAAKAKVIVSLFWQRFPACSEMESVALESTIEESYHVPGFGSVPFAGTLDSIRRHKETGYIWIDDYKTSGRDIGFTLTGYQWSVQPRMYRLLCPDAVGFNLYFLQTPAIKCCRTDEKRAAETGVTVHEAYLQRCRQWYEDNMASEPFRAFNIRFNETLFPDEFTKVLLTKVLPHWMGEPDHRSSERDLTTSHCRIYESTCIYEPLCSIPPSAWLDTINRYYDIQPPKPITQDPGQEESSNHGNNDASD